MSISDAIKMSMMAGGGSYPRTLISFLAQISTPTLILLMVLGEESEEETEVKESVRSQVGAITITLHHSPLIPSRERIPINPNPPS